MEFLFPMFALVVMAITVAFAMFHRRQVSVELAAKDQEIERLHQQLADRLDSGLLLDWDQEINKIQRSMG